MSAHNNANEHFLNRENGNDIFEFSGATPVVDIGARSGVEVIVGRDQSTTGVTMPDPADYPLGAEFVIHNFGTGNATLANGISKVLATDKSLLVKRGVVSSTGAAYWRNAELV